MSTKLLLRIASLIRRDIILSNIPIVPVNIADKELAKQVSLDYNKLMYFNRRDILEQVVGMLNNLVAQDIGVTQADVLPAARKLVRNIESNISKKLERGLTSPEGVAYYTTDRLDANLIYNEGTPNTELKHFLIKEAGIKALKDVPDADFERAGIRFQIPSRAKSISLSLGYKRALLSRVSNFYTDLRVNEAELAALQEGYNKRKVGLAKALGLTPEVLKTALEVTLAVSSKYEGTTLRHRKSIRVDKSFSAMSDLSRKVWDALEAQFPNAGAKGRGHLSKQIARLIDSSDFSSSVTKALEKNITPEVITSTFDTTNIIDEAIRTALIHGKATKRIKQPSSSVTSKSNLKSPNTSSKVTSDKAKLKTKLKIEADKLKKSARVPSMPIRDLRGKFQSVTNLLFILSAINDQVARNMRRPHLEYQTGRFSNSVAINRVLKTREGAVQVFYTYMKYPYQTFEPGYKQGHKGYDPRVLIDTSIRELLTPYLRNSLLTIRE